MNTIIFDLGMVLIRFKWQQALSEMGYSGADIEDLSQSMFNMNLWEQFDYGIKDDETILSEMKAVNPDRAGDIDRIWEADHFKTVCEMYPYAEELVRTLHERGYKIYVLSNYGERLIKLGHPDFTFFEYVDGAVFSYEVKSIKPEPAMYEELMERYQIKEGEAVFFDDREANCQRAEEYGIQGVPVTGLASILEGLKLHFQEDLSELGEKYPEYL